MNANRIVSLASFLTCLVFTASAQTDAVAIHTAHTSLVYKVAGDGTLIQAYYGKRIADDQLKNIQTTDHEAYSSYGKAYVFEPAFRVVHADGNLTTELKYVGKDVTTPEKNISVTRIQLKDSFYDLTVSLYVKAYQNEDILEQWTEVVHGEKKDIVLHDFASSQLSVKASAYWLTSFYGNWANEMNMHEEKLVEGSKILESKLGVRSNQFSHPCFLLGVDESPNENEGTVIGGTLAWPGSWRLSFEVDPSKNLRILSGINPFASQYTLKAKEVFKTPALLFTLSNTGKGEISRRFHTWARTYGIHKSERPHMTLLNNWEATYFDFNEPVLKQIIADGADMGFDLFLLDDGWFANKYPRNNDDAGLGDWEVNKKKLPNGIGELVKEAKAKNIKFGIWIEPEMVNPKSELYEKHPDWVITGANRAIDVSRNQLVLDLSNPKVQNHVFSVVDKILTENPDVAYMKWDCNRYMTNVGSSFLPAEKQTHLFIKYAQGLLDVLKRVRQKYPDVVLMACSGGGARIDYATLPFFDEYWISDNTDALDRIFIQWGTSYFFPLIGLASHVSVVPNHITKRITPLKFRFDVAMSAKLGMDLQPKDMNAEDKTFSRSAIQAYNGIKHIIQSGDLYRLLSPYETNRVALQYATPDKKESLVFSYLMKKEIAGNDQVLYLKGLDPAKEYTVKEVNKAPGKKSRLALLEGKKFTGDFLMTYGVRFPMSEEFESVVFQLVSE
ncbi:alpha-galactosidase [Chryseolinea lacunae]|uniref:Alpha-galactosidase n=1 Tax=Chryseolinea lacunae TaxID=2801331 RepID=A0ABS1L1D2_9BACT|nr:alpha-galactosidase [Chryseolinea lacunae]MBL0745514.1 alpha-galactosidase [Chryseolinea lacunae]